MSFFRLLIKTVTWSEKQLIGMNELEMCLQSTVCGVQIHSSQQNLLTKIYIKLKCSYKNHIFFNFKYKIKCFYVFEIWELLLLLSHTVNAERLTSH